MTDCESLILNEFDIQYHEINKEISEETKHFKANMVLERYAKFLQRFSKDTFAEIM